MKKLTTERQEIMDNRSKKTIQEFLRRNSGTYSVNVATLAKFLGLGAKTVHRDLARTEELYDSATAAKVQELLLATNSVHPGYKRSVL